MRRFLQLALAATCLAAVQVFAQSAVPDIAFDATDPLILPNNIYLGEAAGVATNSKGDIFVYTRTGHPVMTIGPFGRSHATARGSFSSIERGSSFAR